ncbi:MAG: uracil phosphoribosyltransferase [Candidatus Poriferisodalaceae bacterium]|jgi:uracil phosphoribosyltransferase
MSVTTIDSPLVGSKLSRLRAETTGTDEFRRLLADVGTLLTPAATEFLPTEPVTVTTPLANTQGVALVGGSPVLVSVLRAGNGLLDGVLRVISDAEVGVIGLYRDEETLEAHQYLVRLPKLAGRQVIVVDPMLATGHSATAALDIVAAEQPASIVFMCLVAAPEGIAELQSHHPDVRIVTAAIDSHLNDVGYIVPGLGDAGDRLFGTTG